MMSFVLSHPHGAVLTKSAKRKIPAAGMTNAKARSVAGSIARLPLTPVLAIITVLALAS